MEGLMPRFSLFPISALVGLFAGPTLAAELAPYKTVLAEGNFEIRDYPARRVVAMHVVGPLGAAASDGFRIFAEPTLPPGKAVEQFRLTTPVVETPALKGPNGDPLTQVWSAEVWTVSFQPPAGWAPGKLGYAKNPPIGWIDEPQARVAVLRFGKNWDKGVGWGRVAKEFMSQVSVRGLKTQGRIMLAQYGASHDAISEPYEVMIALKDDASKAAGQ
jgi:hypothetical protein